MADTRLRELERRSAQGDVAAHARLVVERKKLGEWTEPVHLQGGKSHIDASITIGVCGAAKFVYEKGATELTANTMTMFEGTPSGRRSILVLTTEPGLVTCGGCKRTRKFRGLTPSADPRKIHLQKWLQPPHETECGIEHIPPTHLTCDSNQATCKRCLRCAL
ncbi:hypothetical protein LCGC14_0274270 [marine sediment metagenome]|uniref:Uncharacterized protein n=2 Tax=root TaxID=1 RepID=A0A9C9TG37_9HYPH|nr:hypothetical protein [Aurantimonas coralicida]